MDPLSSVSNALAALRLELAVEVARTFGSLRLRVTGTSMLPAIQPGDLLSIGRVNLRDTSPGEIVLFTRAGRLFAHRIVDRGGGACEPYAREPYAREPYAREPYAREPYIVTRGDRLLENDPPVFQSELLGRVTSIDRAGSLLRFPPRPWLDGPNRVLRRFLRSSDRATVLFLRVTALWRAFSLG
jgi:signal peptidase